MYSTSIRTLREEGLRGLLEAIYQFGIWRVAEADTVQRRITGRCVMEDQLPAVAERSISYATAERVQVDGPVYDRGTGDFSGVAGTYRLPEPAVYEIKNARLVGPHALAETQDREWILANASGRVMGLSVAALETEISKRVRRGFQRCTEVESAVSLVGPFARNYYHWFVDYLPRLWGLEAYERATQEAPAVIYPNDPPAWLTDSLSLFISEDRLIKWHGQQSLVGSLVVPSARKSTVTQSDQAFSTDAFEWIRNHVVGAIEADVGDPDRIYISRNDANERRVRNEADVIQLLSEFDFRPYTLSELSFRDQVRLFQGAECVVSPHGSGLTNILWAEEAAVIELFGDLTPRMYATMAGQLGHDYAPVFGEQVGEDIRMDLSELRDTVEHVLSVG